MLVLGVVVVAVDLVQGLSRVQSVLGRLLLQDVQVALRPLVGLLR